MEPPAAGAGARCVGAKGSTASASGGASSSAFLALLALAALASLPPRLAPVFFFDAGFLGCALWPMGTSSSSESSSGFASVACAWSCEIGTRRRRSSFAGAGAGASLSTSSSFAFLLVTRVPPRRPRAIVFVRVVALRVNANSHARRATGSKIACATSGNSLAFAGSTEARENALAAAATPPPLLCGAAVSCVRLACVPLLLTKASREEVLHALVAVVANVSRLAVLCADGLNRAGDEPTR